MSQLSSLRSGQFCCTTEMQFSGPLLVERRKERFWLAGTECRHAEPLDQLCIMVEHWRAVLWSDSIKEQGPAEGQSIKAGEHKQSNASPFLLFWSLPNILQIIVSCQKIRCLKKTCAWRGRQSTALAAERHRVEFRGTSTIEGDADDVSLSRGSSRQPRHRLCCCPWLLCFLWAIRQQQAKARRPTRFGKDEFSSGHV